MSKHTKGKWTVKEKDSNTILIQADIGVAVTIAQISHPFGDDESKANAHLIATAPELLEACKNLLSSVDDFKDLDNAVLKIRNAIAKAETL